MSDKLRAYMGFCARSGNLQRGYNKCLGLIERRKAFLLIVAEDVSQNTTKKIVQKCESRGIDYRIQGKAGELSQMTGSSGNGVYAVTDSQFAKVIAGEIDRIQSEGAANGEKSV